MGIGNKVVWVGSGMGRGHQADRVLFVGIVCVCVCGAEGGLGGHDQASNVTLVAKYLQPSSFLIICTVVNYSLPVS